MKKNLALALLFVLIFNLCACRFEAKNEIQDEIVTGDKPEEYWQVQITNQYPLGAKGQVEAVAICDNFLFAVGNENQRFSLVRFSYNKANVGIVFGTPQQMKVPTTAIKAKVLDANANNEKLAVLVGLPSNENKDSFTYQVWLYNTDGTFESEISIDYPLDQLPFSILVLPNGQLGITSDSTFSVYNYTGEHVLSLSLPENDFLSAMLVDDTVVLQSTSMESGNLTLSYVDFEKAALIPVENIDGYGVNKSICRSQVADAIINNGSKIMSIDETFSSRELFDWYSITGDYGHRYSYVIQLSESDLLTLNTESQELKYINTKYAKDTREALTIAVYGHAQDMEDQLIREFNKVPSKYRVQVECYGNDEEGMTRLISDLSGNNVPDLIVSEGYLVNNALGFVDIYTLIDNDPELSREDFLPIILNGLERDGELPQIWTTFGLFSAVAKGPLAYGPEPLKLADCQAFLDAQGYTNPLFDEYITRENLLSLLADNIIHNAWDRSSNSCNLKTEEIKRLIDLCCERPKEFDFTSGEPMIPSEVLSWRDVSMEYLSYMENENIAYRLFAGDGDNLAQIAAYFNSCYMIPEKCQNVEKSWSFLRELLKKDYQIQMTANGFSGFPTNAKAFDEIVRAFLPDGGYDDLISAIEGAAFSGYDMVQMRNIFVEKLSPYVYGRTGYETALNNAQNSINIFFAEHAS